MGKKRVSYRDLADRAVVDICPIIVRMFIFKIIWKPAWIWTWDLGTAGPRWGTGGAGRGPGSTLETWMRW